MKVVLVGAGNLATSLGHALFNAGYDIVQVYSRTMASAEALAAAVGGSPVTDLTRLSGDADVYVVAVKDSVIADIVPTLCAGREGKVFLHTAGSISVDVFKGMALHYGVLYPMQSFSKAKVVEFNNIPCFIEGNDDFALNTAATLADSVSDKVFFLNSEARKRLHLAAVFACNFVNHCYTVAADLLAKSDLPFDVMLPLIDETAGKVHQLSPRDAQTGPAVRYDQNVIRMQSEMLKDNPIYRQIYESMSLSIHREAQRERKKSDDKL